MKNANISLNTQIKKAIGNRILFCCTIFMLIILSLTIYDASISITQLRNRINEQVKPIEDFAINQAIINNLDTIDLKIESFNETHTSFKMEWIRSGHPQYINFSWRFPFKWIYDYHIGEIGGLQFGYFRITGNLTADKTLIYDLIFRLGLFIFFTISVISILYPLARKIPEQLFIMPINRFMDLVSNNSSYNTYNISTLPIELQTLEKKILSLLKTATEHERNKAEIELGHLSARLAHDIHSPLAAMEMGVYNILSKKSVESDLKIISEGIKRVRGIANNILERYHNPNSEKNFFSQKNDGDEPRFILLTNIIEKIILQKNHEWHKNYCKIIHNNFILCKESWIYASPNEIFRLLSNLLNNSYESIIDKKHGDIKISLKRKDNFLITEIEDNGIGISKEKIADAIEGVSFKHPGKGLGLSTANQYIKTVGGKLELLSNPGDGTKVTFNLPSKTPSWLPQNISFKKINTVVILDDDPSILEYWKNELSEKKLNIQFFSSYNTATNWVNKNIALIPFTIFLIDYELSYKNGLDFLIAIKNSNNRYLITSHAENLIFQEKAILNNIWLIPKKILHEISIIE